MKFRNPARHYPSYLCNVYFKDGRCLNVRGVSSPELDLPFEDEEVLVVVVKILDISREVKMTQLLVDGKWSEYSDVALEDILSPPMTMPKPKVKPKVKPKRKIEKLPRPEDNPTGTKLKMQTEVTVDKDTDKE